MKNLIEDPSCYSSLYRTQIKSVWLSTAHKYKDGVFKFFLNVKGKVKEFAYKTLRQAANARKLVVSKIKSRGYLICQ